MHRRVQKAGSEAFKAHRALNLLSTVMAAGFKQRVSISGCNVGGDSDPGHGSCHWSSPVLCVTFYLFQFYVLPLAQRRGREIDDTSILPNTPADEDKLGANTSLEHYRCYIDAVLQQGQCLSHAAKILKVCSQQILVLHYCRSGHAAGIYSQ